MLITKNGTVRIEDGTGYHVGTVNQGRWRRLATVSDQKDLIRALPGSHRCRKRSVLLGCPRISSGKGLEPPSMLTSSLVAARSRPQPASKRPGEDTGGDTTKLRRAR